MSLLRFSGRVLYSAYFVADGYKLLTKPDQNSYKIAPAVDRLVPAVQSFLPPDAADRVPEDVRTWTRVLGLAQIVGAVTYATGIARRPGALLLGAATLPRMTASQDRSEMLGQVALFGAAVVATQDTAGRPGLAWRAAQSRRVIEHKTDAAGKAAAWQTGQARKAVTGQAHLASKTVGSNLKLARVHLEKAGTQAELATERALRMVKDVLN